MGTKMKFDLGLEALTAVILLTGAEAPPPEPKPEPGTWNDAALGCAPEDEADFDRFRGETLTAWDGRDRGIDQDWHSTHRPGAPPMAQKRRRRGGARKGSKA